MPYADQFAAHDHTVPDFVSTQQEEKRCPSCEKTFVVGPQDWYLKKDKRTKRCPAYQCDWTAEYRFLRPQAYCKKCQNRYTTATRRMKAKIERMPMSDAARALIEDQGTHVCSVCGERRVRLPRLVPGEHPVTEPGRVCQECKGYLIECNWSLDFAKDRWEMFSKHIAEENAVEATWMQTRDRRRRPHQGVTFKPPWTSHALCVTREQMWRKVMVFLARNKAAEPLLKRATTWGGSTAFETTS